MVNISSKSTVVDSDRVMGLAVGGVEVVVVVERRMVFSKTGGPKERVLDSSLLGEKNAINFLAIALKTDAAMTNKTMANWTQSPISSDDCANQTAIMLSFRNYPFRK